MARTKGTRDIDINRAFILYCTPAPDGRLWSYADIAKMIGCSRQRIEKWGSRQNWVAKREKIGREQIKKVYTTLAEEIKKKQKLHLKQWEKIAAVAERIIDDQSQLYQDGVFLLNDDGKKFSVYALSEAAEILKKGINGQRVVLGLPTDVSRSQAVNYGAGGSMDPEIIQKMDNYVKLNYHGKPKPQDAIIIEQPKELVSRFD